MTLETVKTIRDLLEAEYTKSCQNNGSFSLTEYTTFIHLLNIFSQGDPAVEDRINVIIQYLSELISNKVKP